MKRPSDNLFSNLVKCLNAKVEWDKPATFKSQAQKPSKAPKAPFSPASPKSANRSMKAKTGKKFA